MRQIDIKDWEEYQITDDGRVWSKKTNKWLKACVGNNGYYMINLCTNGKCKTVLLHRLIAEAFIENQDNKPCIDHINGNRLDNSLENLRWCTYTENNTNPIYIKRKTGVKRSEECRRKMSIAKIGKPSPMKGKRHTEEAKLKNRLAHLGIKHPMNKENET